VNGRVWWVRSSRGLWLFDNQTEQMVRSAIEKARDGAITGTVEFGDNVFPDGWPRAGVE
jgi:hypothetical protein